MKAKTLKDLNLKELTEYPHAIRNVFKDEAIKWVKEEMEEYNLDIDNIYLKRWMKRLNITEEDLR